MSESQEFPDRDLLIEEVAAALRQREVESGSEAGGKARRQTTVRGGGVVAMVGAGWTLRGGQTVAGTPDHHMCRLHIFLHPAFCLERKL